MGIRCEGVMSGEAEKGPAGLACMGEDLELQSKVLVTQGADCNVVQSTAKLSVTKGTPGGQSNCWAGVWGLSRSWPGAHQYRKCRVLGP